MAFVIFSNNSRVGEVEDGISVRRIAGGLDEFYEATGAALQNGYELVSSLLPPNVPLIRSPVRSVILRQAKRKYDAQGLMALEKARERTSALGVKDDARIMRDLEFIDRDHLLRALEQLRELGMRQGA